MDHMWVGSKTGKDAERHLTGFGESLICRVLASPKLSVRTKTIKSIDGETPKPNWLLH